MRLRVALLAAALLLPGCGRGTGGPLDPVDAPGVARVDDERFGTAAVVRDGAVTARVSGRWATEGEQTLRVSLRNGGRTVVRVPVAALGLSLDGRRAAPDMVADVTGVDLTDARSDNDEARVLLEGGGTAGTLELPPGGSRELDVALARFAGGRVAAEGDRVVATVPMGARTAQIAFICSDPSSWPF